MLGSKSFGPHRVFQLLNIVWGLPNQTLSNSLLFPDQMLPRLTLLLSLILRSRPCEEIVVYLAAGQLHVPRIRCALVVLRDKQLSTLLAVES